MALTPRPDPNDNSPQAQALRRLQLEQMNPPPRANPPDPRERPRQQLPVVIHGPTVARISAEGERTPAVSQQTRIKTPDELREERTLAELERGDAARASSQAGIPAWVERNTRARAAEQEQATVAAANAERQRAAEAERAAAEHAAAVARADTPVVVAAPRGGAQASTLPGGARQIPAVPTPAAGQPTAIPAPVVVPAPATPRDPERPAAPTAAAPAPPQPTAAPARPAEPAAARPAAQPTAATAPRRPVSGTEGRPPPQNDADALNAMVLNATSGGAPSNDPREANIRRRLQQLAETPAAKKGGKVEKYAKGGRVGGKCHGDGLAKRGRTKGRFI